MAHSPGKGAVQVGKQGHLAEVLFQEPTRLRRMAQMQGQIGE